MVCGTSGLDSGEQALAVGGAAVIGPFGRRGQVAARAVGEGHVLNRTRGHFDPDDASSAVGAPSHSGAAAAQSADRPGTVNGRVVQAAVLAFVHPSRVVRVVGRVSHGGPRSWNRVAAVGSVPRAAKRVVQYAAAPSPAVARAHPERRVTRLVHHERLASFTGHASCFATAGVTTRRSAGHSRVVALSGVGVGEGSCDRPVQHANGADALDGLVRSCPRGARLICNV